MVELVIGVTLGNGAEVERRDWVPAEDDETSVDTGDEGTASELDPEARLDPEA